MSHNFQFLEQDAPLLFNIGQVAEKIVHIAPAASIGKLRLLSEKLVKEIFAIDGFREPEDRTHHARLRTLRYEDAVPHMVMDMFHAIRTAGNRAVHEDRGTVEEALNILSMTFKVCQWFAAVYLGQDVSKLTYTPPEAEPEAQAKEESNEIESKYQELEAKYEALLKAKEKQAVAEEDVQQRKSAAIRQASKLNLNEAETRLIIDEKLRDAGWEADSQNLSYKKGVRPEKGRNIAIAEWKVGKKYADYALFVGLDFVGIVEAKRKNKDVVSDLGQAKIYSKLADIHGDENDVSAWGEYKVPFLFSTNGRPFLKNLPEKSGVWFLDARRSSNHPRALQDWYTPQGLKDLLKLDESKAYDRLKTERFDYLTDSTGLGLRSYQVEAIQAVEKALSEGRREVLIAMATGCGKTRLTIGLLYRLLKSDRFKRILFLVDRSVLGNQAADAFKDATLEDLLSFTETYDVKELKDKKPDVNTKVHIATVQGMVKRVFYNANETEIPNIDQYDCILVDESHRGYILDRELSEEELAFKNEADYLGKYRRVLDYFDSVKIGLTATPAAHTLEIFRNIVYQYSYREAVIDGFLCDHEPPYLIDTQLKREGIQWKVGEEVTTYKVNTGEVEKVVLDDEMDIDIAGFNTKVVTENFNRAIVSELVKHLDPDSPEKTLIFAATDNHADMVVRLLKEAFEEAGQPVDDDAIKKITGSIYEPQQAIRRFKNEKYPNIVVTVDLLSTGVDVPEIANIVFIRRVRSRILYEQMLGRATRRADHIGKETFKIFDAVGIYDLLKDFTDMKPVSRNPNIPFNQLLDELEQIDQQSEFTEDKVQYRMFAQHVDEIVSKLQRKKRRMSPENEELFSTRSGGLSLTEFIEQLQDSKVMDAVETIKQHREAFQFLDEMRSAGTFQLISDHEDHSLGVTRGYGNADKPEDYIEGFKAFIENNMNQIMALRIVCTRPKELTRQALKALRYELDKAGYNETRLQTAWKEMKNEAIAADIISFIRQQALGDALVSHEARIHNAMQKVLKMRDWSKIQIKWLQRIEKQLLEEYVISKDDFDKEPFRKEGGYHRINKIFAQELDHIIELLNENLYAS